MKRRALSTLIVVQVFAWLLGMSAIVARADECSNSWKDSKEVVGKGAKKTDAVDDLRKKSKEVGKDTNCKADKCGKDKGVCRMLRTGAQSSCTGDDEKGWTCTGNFRVGCFCLEPKEQGHIAPTPKAAPTPSTTGCQNKFNDPKDAIGGSDKGKTQAQTLHDNKLQEYIDADAEFCAKQKCTGEKKSCRLYYTTTTPKCSESKDPNFPGWSCRSQYRGGCFCLGDDEEALAMAAGMGTARGEELASSTRPYRGKTVLVGVVLAEGCGPNRPCTVSLVPNPDELAGTPGVVVKKERVQERRDAHGHVTLQGMVVASNQAKRQPADGAITFLPEPGAESSMDLEVALVDTPGETVRVPINDLPPSHRKPTDKASAPPVLPDNGVCVVHDKFSGNGHATKVKMNGTEIPVLAESQDMTVFRPGNAAKSGENEYTITDNGKTKTYKLTAPSVAINAGQTTLEQNQSTQFQVTVSDAGGIPADSWSSPEGASGASMGGGGYLLLTITNDSPNTTTLSGGNVITVPIHRSDLASGTYTYNGTVTAQQPGPFQIEAKIDPYLAEALPIDVVNEPTIARGAETGCCQYNNPASGNWCAIETQSECLGTWKGSSYGCNQSGTCGLNLPLGGNERSELTDKTVSSNEPTVSPEQTLEEPHGEKTGEPPVVIPPIAPVPEIPLAGRPHDAANDCPQRHDGCLALAINFLRAKPAPPKPMKGDWNRIEIPYTAMWDDLCVANC